MVRDLIALPLRIGAAAGGVASHLAERAVLAGVNATERLIELGLTALGGASADAAPAPAPTPAPPPPPMPPEEPAPPVTEPAPPHVSRDARVVAASADPGAEDGPGAAVRIQEPWDGYGRMTASDVIARLADASAEELAAVALYERAHRD